MRRATIDIGTNSVKLLVAEVAGGLVLPLWEESEQTRLGQGFYQSHRLQPGPIEQTAQAVARFVKQAREWNAVSTRVIATSAARDAVNQDELLDRVEALSGLRIEVISGEQEADWVFAGVRTDPALREKSLLVLDVGGGSTEFILGRGAAQEFRESFPIGTVRLLEQIRPSDPPLPGEWDGCYSELRAFLEAQVQPLLGPCLRAAGDQSAWHLVGTGGTTSILGAMELRLTSFDREKLEQTTLSVARVRELGQLLWSLPLIERKKVPGLPPNRADVVLFGVAIFLAVMDQFGFDKVRISTRGLRFAAVADVA